MTTEGYYKLILVYDVDPNVTQEYYQFIMGRYIPMMQRMGFEMMEAWTTAWGDAPNRQIGIVARDRATMLALQENATWLALNEQLTQYVTDFDYKFVPFRDGFQI